MLDILIEILIPFIGTTLGSLMVFFMKDNINKKLEKFLLGFSSGIMIAASIWSLLLPAISDSEGGNVPNWLQATIGLIIGLLFLFLTRNLLSSSKTSDNIELDNKNSMLFFAVTLHNIPEGLAVGVAASIAYFGEGSISSLSALMLSVGIAIQNFPEGAIISMPLKSMGMRKSKAFLMGTFSGIVEPIAALIAFFVTGFVTSILPYVLSFAAGAMIYVAVQELIPESQEKGFENLATFGFFLGFIIMMIMDIVLG